MLPWSVGASKLCGPAQRSKHYLSPGRTFCSVGTSSLLLTIFIEPAGSAVHVLDHFNDFVGLLLRLDWLVILPSRAIGGAALAAFVPREPVELLEVLVGVVGWHIARLAHGAVHVLLCGRQNGNMLFRRDATIHDCAALNTKIFNAVVRHVVFLRTFQSDDGALLMVCNDRLNS